MRLLSGIAIVALLADQASKYAVLWGLNLRHVAGYDLWPPLLTFRYGENTGINFGLFDGGSDVMRWALVALSVGISLGLFIWLRRPHHGRLMHIAGGLMIGGALANGLDRVIQGYVIDFLNMSCCGIENPYVFNLADVFIFAGVLGIGIFDGRSTETENRA
jgi:signal peptidase II